jgi:uncharacterized protein (DUF1810 family)
MEIDDVGVVFFAIYSAITRLSMMADPFDLRRFVEAQASAYAGAVAELRRGRKQGHWMWFIFPQIQGLGQSAMARQYAISGLAEAHAYLEHATLGPRLRECTQLVNQVEGKTALQILGSPDDMKFRSSVTLFGHAADDDAVFVEALGKYFEAKPDPLTIGRLK